MVSVQVQAVRVGLRVYRLQERLMGRKSLRPLLAAEIHDPGLGNT